MGPRVMSVGVTVAVLPPACGASSIGHVTGHRTWEQKYPLLFVFGMQCFRQQRWHRSGHVTSCIQGTCVPPL